MRNKKIVVSSAGGNTTASTKTPQYEYARKQVDSWPEWKKNASMSGLTIDYRGVNTTYSTQTHN